MAGFPIRIGGEEPDIYNKTVLILHQPPLRSIIVTFFGGILATVCSFLITAQHTRNFVTHILNHYIIDVPPAPPHTLLRQLYHISIHSFLDK